MGAWQYRPQVFLHQTDATLSQANPVSGTKYTVLDTTKNVRIISIIASVTWTVQPNPLEIHVTIDGISITHTFANPITATNYICLIAPAGAATAQTMIATSEDLTTKMRAFLWEGRSIKIEAETTGGTVSNLSARAKYAKM